MLFPLFGSMGFLPSSENSTYFLNKRLHLNLNISSLNKKSTGKMTNDNLYIWPRLFKRWIVLSSGRINIYPVDSAIGFPNTYALVSDLSDG